MKAFIAALIGLFFAMPVFASREFSVAPTHVFVDLHHRKIQKFIVTNTGDTRIHIGIKPLFMKADSRSLTLGHVLAGQQESEYDLSPYVVLSPHAISLAPGQQRELRMSISAPPNLVDGAYRTHLLFYQIQMPTAVKPKTEKQSDTAHEMKMQLNMRLELAVSVYGTKGNGDAKLSFQCAKDAQGKLQLAVTNDSPWRFEGTLQVRSTGSDSESPVDLVMLRNTVRKVATKIEAQSNQYTLTWQADKPYLGQGSANCVIG